MEKTALTRSAAGASVRGRSIVEEWHSSLDLEVAAGQLAEASAETYKRGLAKFREWGQAKPERATDHVIKEWLASLRESRMSQNTISVWFAGVRAFFQWAVSEKHLQLDPTAGVKRGKRTAAGQEHKRDLLTDDEMLRVLNSDISTRDRAIVHLLAYTGARGIELQRAGVEDLRTVAGELVLHVQGKGRLEKDERIVIAHLDAKDAVYGYLAERGSSCGPLFLSQSNRSRGERLSSRALRMIVFDILKKAGVKTANKTTHSFRHSAVTSAIRNGATLQDAQAMARHSDPATTQIYIHNIKRIENAAEKLIKYGD